MTQPYDPESAVARSEEMERLHPIIREQLIRGSDNVIDLREAFAREQQDRDV